MVSRPLKHFFDGQHLSETVHSESWDHVPPPKCGLETSRSRGDLGDEILMLTAACRCAFRVRVQTCHWKAGRLDQQRLSNGFNMWNSVEFVVRISESQILETSKLLASNLFISQHDFFEVCQRHSFKHPETIQNHQLQLSISSAVCGHRQAAKIRGFFLPRSWNCQCLFGIFGQATWWDAKAALPKSGPDAV